MIIQIVGKAHRSGTSKRTGNPYSFTEIHYLGTDRFVEGKACKTKVVSDDLVQASSILVGQHYNIEFDENGSIIAFSPAKS